MKDNQYTIRELKTSEHHTWDKFVRNSITGTLFHLTSWADTIKFVFKRPYIIVALIKNDIIISGILYWPKEGMISSITSATLTPYQGILHTRSTSEKKSSVNADIQKRTDLILDHLCEKYAFIEFPLSIGITDTRYYKWKNFTPVPVYTYIIELNSNKEITKHFNQSLRRKINLSNKQNLSVVLSKESSQITRFIIDSYKYHNTTPPVNSRNLQSFLDKIIKNNLGRIYYLNKNDEFVCGLVILHDENNIYALFSGMNSKYRDSQYTQYLHSSILLLPEFKGKKFDFLGANSLQFEQFKRSFGGNLQVFFRVTYYKNSIIRSIHHLRSIQQLFSRKIPRYKK